MPGAVQRPPAAVTGAATSNAAGAFDEALGAAEDAASRRRRREREGQGRCVAPDRNAAWRGQCRRSTARSRKAATQRTTCIDAHADARPGGIARRKPVTTATDDTDPAEAGRRGRPADPDAGRAGDLGDHDDRARSRASPRCRPATTARRTTAQAASATPMPKPPRPMRLESRACRRAQRLDAASNSRSRATHRSNRAQAAGTPAAGTTRRATAAVAHGRCRASPLRRSRTSGRGAPATPRQTGQEQADRRPGPASRGPLQPRNRRCGECLARSRSGGGSDGADARQGGSDGRNAAREARRGEPMSAAAQVSVIAEQAAPAPVAPPLSANGAAIVNAIGAEQGWRAAANLSSALARAGSK